MSFEGHGEITVPVDGEAPIRELGQSVRGPASLNRLRLQVIGWILTVIAVVVLAAFVSLTSAVVVGLFGVAFLLNVDVRLPIATSLALLIVCPMLLALKEQPTAEAFANWAYYLFSIAVVVQLIRYVRSGRGTHGEAGGPT
jgi:hypothetical protein